jgi:phage terminase large subunit-like protein
LSSLKSNYVLDYWQDIQSGKVVVSKKVYKVYSKLAEEIETATDSKWRFDLRLANRPVEFIETLCKHSKGEWMGKPIELELFQKAFISALFGFVDEQGARRFKETFFLVARKNGKSTLLSGIMLYMMIADGEGGAQIVSAATKREQSSIVFNEALNMVSQSPDLRSHVKKRKTDLYFPLTFSTMTALSSDSNTLDGLNLHLAVIDELHAIRDRNLYEVLKQGMSARRSPMMVMITTAGTVRENIYDDMYDYSCKVVDGTIQDERFLPILYELDSRDEWTDYRMWEKANPGLGRIKKLEDITEKVERAKANPKDLPGILCKDFNVRSTSSESWLTFEQVHNPDTFDISEVTDCYAVGGVDLSSTTDLTCATLLIMKEDGKKYVMQQYFLPEELIEKRKQEDKIPYDMWKERGFLTTSEGYKVNYSDVTAWFLKMYEEHSIRPVWIGYDPWSSTYWVDEMKQYGFQMKTVRQGARTLSQPMKEMSADLSSKSINYNMNPMLIWCLTNTAIAVDSNDNIKPVKGRYSRMRIDGAVSLIIAYTVLFNNLSDYKALM